MKDKLGILGTFGLGGILSIFLYLLDAKTDAIKDNVDLKLDTQEKIINIKLDSIIQKQGEMNEHLRRIEEIRNHGH